ncbi:DUF6314 family protein [Halomonas sp. H5]|uniref:DUF6314 family protein n=1 Tax=Halomonas sp. H5 TaxID=3423910 RepID=UPI003D35AB17
MTAIIRLAECLTSIRRLAFISRPGPDSRSGWAGRARGEVRVEVSVEAQDKTIRFFESGTFLLEGRATPVPFSNCYRWELGDTRIALFHERRGADQAVWLFALIAQGPASLVSAEAHLCGEDRYRARLSLVDEGFDLSWTIQGPRKDESLSYRYRR